MKLPMKILIFVFLFAAVGHAFVELNTARIAYFNERDYGRARESCLQGIEKGQEHFELYTILGGSEIALGNWQAGADALVRAFEIDTTKTLEWIESKGGGPLYYYQAFYFSAKNLYHLGKYEKALSHLAHEDLLNPDDVSTLILRGAILYKLGRIEQANQEYRRVLEMDPDNADVYFLLGKALFEIENFDSSIVFFREARDLYQVIHERNAQAVFQNLPEITGQLTRDILILWAAQDLKELDHLIKTQLELAEGLSAHQQALENFSKTAEDLARVLYYMGMAYYYLEKDSLALRHLEQSLDYHPDDTDALYFAGELLVKAKQYQSARDYFEKVTKLKPDDIFAWFYLGVCYTQLKKYNSAIDVYENKVLVADPDHIDALTNLAFVYNELGNTRKANEYLKRADEVQKEQ